MRLNNLTACIPCFSIYNPSLYDILPKSGNLYSILYIITYTLLLLFVFTLLLLFVICLDWG